MTGRFKIRELLLTSLATVAFVHPLQGQTATELLYMAYDTPDADEAIGFFTQAVVKDPNLVYAYAGRGLRKQELGDITGAIADFTKAIETNPLFRDAYVWRAEARKQQGDTRGYRQDLQAAEEARKRGDHAMAELNRGTQSPQDQAQGYLERARHKKNKGDNSGAVEDYNRYLALVGRPKNHLVLFERANAKKRSGDVDGALDDYSTVLRMFPGNADAYAKRAALRRESGDTEGADADLQSLRAIQRAAKLTKVEQLTEALEATPDSSYLLLQRSRLLLDIGNYTNALHDARAVREDDPNVIQAKRLEKKIQRVIREQSQTTDGKGAAPSQ